MGRLPPCDQRQHGTVLRYSRRWRSALIVTLAAWLHDIDPFLIRFSGDFGLRWYGLSYAAGFVLAWLALRFLAGRGAVLIPKDRLSDAIIYAALGAVVGGRLGYVLFYQPSLLWTITDAFPFWGVLSLNHGGMASHGGMIGVAIAAFLVSRGFKDEQGVRSEPVPLLHVFDLYALVAPFGLMLGRIANFINGELLGKVVAKPGEEAPWWAVRFPQEIGSGHDLGLRTPEQERQLTALLDTYRLPDQPAGAGLQHIIENIQSGSTEAARQLEPLLSARVPSQLIQAIAEGVVLGLVLWIIAHKPRQPGVISAWFLICYGVLRIATEFVRLPDPGISGLFGLSRGQTLSSIMILLGIALLAGVVRRSAPKVGGWGRGSPVDQSA
ncbi:MAG TPA: prolipoprotein diacylglyceryl transferase [Phycisphaerales bacterium]|nr:prolipoprotein diacylglyceryl transferase [Phycisphaerales bacterium]